MKTYQFIFKKFIHFSVIFCLLILFNGFKNSTDHEIPANNSPDSTQAKPVYASITRINPDGTGFEIFSQGVRNTVGFDWSPLSKQIWFTDNGRDNLGDDIPSDELNAAPQAGMKFGFPYCHQGNILDPEFGNGKNCNNYTAPAKLLGAHVPALGMRFNKDAVFPPEYKNEGINR
jgi:glucose/arabinose dehydrogenase